MSAISSILSVAGGGHPQPVRPYLIALDQYNNDAIVEGSKRYFQYWPEDITDNKQTNWENKNIPGLSHPLYQWVSGGAREIAFTAIFTRDRTLSATEQAAIATVNLVTNMPLSAPAASGVSAGASDGRNIDIPSAISWLRSYVYPDYSKDGNGNGSATRAKPPRKLILGLPGMRISWGTAASNHQDEMVAIMTQCDVSYTGFFADGTPRIARVQLQFVETIQYQGRIKPDDAFAIRSVGYAGYKQTVSTSDKPK